MLEPSATRLPELKIEHLQAEDAYLVTWPDGVVIKMGGFEVAHGEDIMQAAIALRKRAGL